LGDFNHHLGKNMVLPPINTSLNDLSTDLDTHDILNSLQIGIVIINLGGQVVVTNSHTASLFGVSVKMITGRFLSEFLPQSTSEIMSIARSDRQAAGLILPELDGCFLLTTPLKGRQKGLVLNILDRRLWQPYLNNGQTLDPLTPFYKKIFESSSDGICISDSRGRMILVNAASAAHVGLKPNEIQGRHVNFLVENNYADSIVTNEVIREKKTVTKLVKHHKTQRHVLLTGTPIFNAEGQVHLVVTNERDLTKMMELEKDFKHQKEILERVKDELTAYQLAELKAGTIVSLSPSMSLTLDIALKLASFGVREILITGESGTGKGLLAKYIHANSKINQEPFVHINCAAMPESLLESELFGFEKGTFTGAAAGGRAGLFEAAGRGVVFLDEIGEMPLPIQAKLLTFLDNHEFRRVGGRNTQKAPCSIIAATNQDLEELVQKKLFRQDLYYRLNVFCVRIPPLRERPEDLLELTRREIEKLNQHYGQIKKLDPLALEVLENHSFPGNVRELLNCLHQAVLLSTTSEIGPFLKKVIESRFGFSPGSDNLKSSHLLLPEESKGYVSNFGRDKEQFEKKMLIEVLANCKNTREMALILGISQAGVSRKLKKYNLNPPGSPGRQKKNQKAKIKMPSK
jgi:PAS domain S-box-containing protein